MWVASVIGTLARYGRLRWVSRPPPPPRWATSHLTDRRRASESIELHARQSTVHRRLNPSLAVTEHQWVRLSSLTALPCQAGDRDLLPPQGRFAHVVHTSPTRQRVNPGGNQPCTRWRVELVWCTVRADRHCR